MKEKDIKKETVQEPVEGAGQEVVKEKHKLRKDGKSEELQKKVDELEKKNAELSDRLSKEHDDYVRLMAEFETFRRRSSEDRLNLVSTASAETIKEILPVLDAIEQAFKMLGADSAEREGIQLIHDKLMTVLKGRGLSVIEARGVKFDPDTHEAVARFTAPSEELKGMVIDVTRTGYALNGKIIRYPQVVVGA